MSDGLTNMADQARLKSAAARAAVVEIENGMLVGLGSGTTMAFAIEALGKRASLGLQVTVVATSRVTARKAEAAGLRILPFDDLDRVDIAIDGADEIDGSLCAIKGHGGAMLREKIVASAARRMIAIVDASKQVTTLGAHPLPIEVLPFAIGFVTRRITELGADAALRMKGRALYRTDQNNAVLDCWFGTIRQPEALAATLSAIPGLLGHGLFVDEIDAAYVGCAEGTRYLSRRPC
jgi:ribose 5-phosphate isomerase A